MSGKQEKDQNCSFGETIKSTDANQHQHIMSSKDEKDNPMIPLEVASDNDSGKCKSVSKKMIKLPRHGKKHLKQKLRTKLQNKELSNTYSKFFFDNPKPTNIIKRNNYKTMKSMSPRKRLQNKLNQSVGDMSNMNVSQGFRSEFNSLNRNKTKNLNFRSLMTFQKAGPGSYNLPDLIGRPNYDTSKKNGP